MSHREIEDFLRDTISLLTTCAAFLEFDAHAMAQCKRHELLSGNSGVDASHYSPNFYVELYHIYEDLQTWFCERNLSHTWRLTTYKGLSNKKRTENMQQASDQVNSKHANDECVNFLCFYAIDKAHIKNRVHTVNSMLVPMARCWATSEVQELRERGKYSAERLHITSAKSECLCVFSANEECDVILVPFHTEAHAHWSLLVYYRVRRGEPSWMAVHYDTLDSLHYNDANFFHSCFKFLVHNWIDENVQFSDQVFDTANMFTQSEAWSCGYRAACVAQFISREASAYDLELSNKSDDEVNRFLEQSSENSLAYRVQKKIFNMEAFEHNINDSACAKLLADALTRVREYELVESVRLRCECI